VVKNNNKEGKETRIKKRERFLKGNEDIKKKREKNGSK